MFDLFWVLFGLFLSIYECIDDSNGSVGGVMDYVMEVVEKIVLYFLFDIVVLVD